MTAVITHYRLNGLIDTHAYPADPDSWLAWCASWSRNGWDSECDGDLFIATKGRATVLATISGEDA